MRTEIGQIMEHLSEEGFRPKVDSDGDVGFKFEGGSYYINARDDDPTFYRLIFPSFWEVSDEEERLRFLEAANLVNVRSKGAKILLVRDHGFAVSQGFYKEVPQFLEMFERHLRAVQASIILMRHELTQGSEDDDDDDDEESAEAESESESEFESESFGADAEDDDDD